MKFQHGDRVRHIRSGRLGIIVTLAPGILSNNIICTVKFDGLVDTIRLYENDLELVISDLKLTSQNVPMIKDLL